jgi:hypothetical protein
MATGVAGAAMASWASREALAQVQRPGKLAALAAAKSNGPGAVTMETVTPYKDATARNNCFVTPNPALRLCDFRFGSKADTCWLRFRCLCERPATPSMH